MDELFEKFYKVIQQISFYQGFFERQLRKYGKPKFINRYWFPISLTAYFSNRIASLLFNYQYFIYETITNTHETLVLFMTDWIIEPLNNILKTIRHKDETLAIMSAESLKSDLTVYTI